MSKFCTHCGAALDEKALFCQFCGTRKKITTEQPILTESASKSIPTAVIPDKQAPRETTSTATVPAKKKHKKVLLICGIVTVVAAALFLLFGNILDDGVLSRHKAPFFGLERGDSVEEVEKRMGDPDDFNDNGLRNYNYYYKDIEFLDMEGYLDIHFQLDKVDTLTFVYTSAYITDYEDTVEYYTDKYGEPEATYSNDSDYYNAVERAFWELDNGSYMMVEHYAGGKYGRPTMKIYIYN